MYANHQGQIWLPIQRALHKNLWFLVNMLCLALLRQAVGNALAFAVQFLLTVFLMFRSMCCAPRKCAFSAVFIPVIQGTIFGFWFFDVTCTFWIFKMHFQMFVFLFKSIRNIFQKINPRTRCLYSATSMFLRSLSADCQSVFSTDWLSPFSFAIN